LLTVHSHRDHAFDQQYTWFCHLVLAAEAAALFIVALAIVDDEISPQYMRTTSMKKTIKMANTKVTMAFGCLSGYRG
jgi:hypothetical protein